MENLRCYSKFSRLDTISEKINNGHVSILRKSRNQKKLFSQSEYVFSEYQKQETPLFLIGKLSTKIDFSIIENFDISLNELSYSDNERARRARRMQAW